MPLTDAHCHLQEAELNTTLPGWWSLAEHLKIHRWLVNGLHESDWAHVAKLAREHPGVIPSFGLHPWYVKDRTPEWLESQPNPLNCSIRLLDGTVDRGYVFEGFGGKPAATDNDKGTDLVEQLSASQSEPDELSTLAALEGRLQALMAEAAAIQAEMETLKRGRRAQPS